MPYKVRFIPSTDFALAEVSGRFTTDELCELFTALIEKRGNLRGLKVFCDVSKADSTDASADVMWPAVDFLRQRQELCAGMKWANFATSILNYGISRMAGQMASDLPFEYRAFTSRDLALHWLAMPLALRDAYIADSAAAS